MPPRNGALLHKKSFDGLFGGLLGRKARPFPVCVCVIQLRLLQVTLALFEPITVPVHL